MRTEPLVPAIAWLRSFRRDWLRAHLVSRYSLCGEGLCIGYDGGDAVSSEYKPRFESTGGRVVKVVFDVADDAYVDVERHMAGAMARD